MGVGFSYGLSHPCGCGRAERDAGVGGVGRSEQPSYLAALSAVVLEPLRKCLPFLFLPAFQDFFPPPVVHIRWSDVADSFVIPRWL